MPGQRFLQVLFAMCCPFLYSAAFAQLTVSPNQTAAALANKLAGPGIIISAPVLTCATQANGTFISVSTLLAIDSGVILTSGRAANAAGVESFLASTNNGTPGDASLNTLAMATTRDACVLEFDLVPKGDSIKFNYQFGSEEYINSTCGPYNDAFAFFISGPGIPGTQNMALVPGTNIPVTVNSINSGVPGTNGNIANCTSMGPGAPFTTYYINNLGGTQLTYRGYTSKLVAQHDVIPCNTYHLKLAIADANNNLYDSGVFIEAGSLRTNTYYVSRIDSLGTTIAGVPNTIVRGCAPVGVKIKSVNTATSAQKVYFTYGGSAVKGVDYTAPDSATIATGTDSVMINIAALTSGSGSQTIKLYLSSPFSCGVVDSFTFNVIDAPFVNILTSDTTICLGKSFQVQASASAGQAFSWSPAIGLSNPTMLQPVAAPSVTSTYTVTATLPPGTGCPTLTKAFSVTITSIGVSITTPDTAICPGESVHIVVNGSAANSYSWSPGAGLNSPTAKEPVATPSATTTYMLTATSPLGCLAVDTIRISVAPAIATILTPDTTVCRGTSVLIRTQGDASLVYVWTPAATFDNAGIPQPTATPVTTTTYHFAASVPGTTCMVEGDVTIHVAMVDAYAGQDEIVCVNNMLQLSGFPKGSNYTYLWTGPDAFTTTERDPLIAVTKPANDGIYALKVTDIVTGCFASDVMNVEVRDGFTLSEVSLSQTINYGGSLQLYAGNAIHYEWTPADGTIDNPNVNNPTVTPLAPTIYTVHGRDQYGCVDSAKVSIYISYDTFFVPSGFTPNGDGLNDLFRAGHMGYYKLVEMTVYNRWGTPVYHTTDGSNKGWDGTYNGAPQDLGVYHYIMVVSKPDGAQHIVKGDVTLIR